MRMYNIIDYVSELFHFENRDGNTLYTNSWGGLSVIVDERRGNIVITSPNTSRSLIIHSTDNDKSIREEFCAFVGSILIDNKDKVDENILQWPFNCNDNYIKRILEELKDNKNIDSSVNFESKKSIKFNFEPELFEEFEEEYSNAIADIDEGITESAAFMKKIEEFGEEFGEDFAKSHNLTSEEVDFLFKEVEKKWTEESKIL